MDIIEQISNRLVNWIDGGKDSPFSLELRPTERCNLKCISCLIPKKNHGDLKKEISYKKYIQIISEAADIGIKRIEIVGGGEPLMLGDGALKLMLEIKKKGMFGSITTNATLFNEKTIKKLVDAEWDLIAVSLDGPDAKTHDFLRGVDGTFDKVVRTIQLFQKWKKKLKKNLPEIIFVPVINNKNYMKIKEMILLAKSLELNKVEFKTLILFDDSKVKELQLNQKQFIRFTKLAKKIKIYANKYNIKTNLSTFADDNFAEKSKDIVEIIKNDTCKEDTRVNIPCFLPFFYMSIDTNGSVSPCVVFQQNMVHENIKEKSLNEIWMGKHFNGFRKKILKGEIPSVCKECCGGIIFDNRRIRAELKEKLKIRYDKGWK